MLTSSLPGVHAILFKSELERDTFGEDTFIWKKNRK